MASNDKFDVPAAQRLKVGELYPVAFGEPLPAGHDRKAARVRATGEMRAPRIGEWFLSGAVIEGYRANRTTRVAYPIGVLVHGEYVATWREIPSE
jgi:hypothetical protein